MSTRWPSSSTRTRCSSSARHRSTRRACRTTSRRSPRSRHRSVRTATSTPAWAGSCCRSPRCSADRSLRGTSGSTVCTTISADIHKLGYAPKGVSVILHRTKESRRYQTFVFDDWLGGFYASPNMQGTRSGLPMACAWAVMSHLGVDGYVELTRQTLANADQIRAGIAAIDGIRVLGDGAFHLVALARRSRRPTGTSTCSHSATRCSRGAGTTTARRRRTTCIRR